MAISFIGAATGTTSATLPAHQAGDLIIAFAYRDGSTTLPTLPTGWTNYDSQGGAQSNCSRLAYRIATSGATTSGTWTSATSVVFHVYRGTRQVSPLGGVASSHPATTNPSFPALTLQITDGTSWVAGFIGHRSTNVAIETPPSGMVNRSAVSDATDEAAGHDTAGGVSSWTAQTASLGGTSSGASVRTVEIIDADATVPTTWAPFDKGSAVTLSNGNLTFTTSSVSANRQVRGTNPKSSGKWYFEVDTGTVDPYNYYLGIATGSYTFGSDPAAGQCAFWFSDGTAFTHTTDRGSIGTYVGGDLISIAVDLDAELIWFRKNGDDWNNSGTADPATGTGGFSFSALTGPYYPFAGSDVASNSGTADFGATAFTHAAPSGFDPWAGATGTTGTLAATETGSDAASMAGSIEVAGSLAATEAGSDDATASGSVANPVTGTLAATEAGSDTASLSGSVANPVTGTLAATETGSDTASISGSVRVSGTLAATEAGSDTASITGTITISGSLAATEAGDDTVALTGTVTISGSLAATEAGIDTAAITGAVSLPALGRRVSMVIASR